MNDPHYLLVNIISKFQAAYIPRDSTSQQLMSMIHQIKLTMASNNIAHGVFLDVSSAFDAVWHDVLLVEFQQFVKAETFPELVSYHIRMIGPGPMNWQNHEKSWLPLIADHTTK